MAMTREDNELLTRVENGAPMGDMIRQHYWIPAVPSAKLVADGAPVLVRLLGTNYVAFRATDGRVGIVDELCPHRRTSLMMARNENNGLRCIFHGWKMDTTGAVVEAPNQVGDQAQFCKRVKTGQYRVEERGGLVWVWLGKGETAPRFPELPFMDLPAEHRSVTSVEVPTNWVQAVEASMDSSHVGVLHESTTQITAGGGNERMIMAKALAPRFDFEDRPYGYRYAALRDMPDEKVYARVNNFVMPWYGIICPPDAKGPTTVFFSTPVDDVTHRAWFVQYNPHCPLGMTIMSATPDVWNFPPLPPGTREESFGQNRDLMKRGHATGFHQHLGTEDFAMFLGQGPIYDRTQEQLCSADGAVLRVRALLLKAAREFVAGKTPTLADSPELDYSKAVSVGGVLQAGADWRTLTDTK
ncbi:aromatic ring-hydroxylating dioxygenase subunit alpha [Paraburkholderia sp. BL10I2N1]|uniref:aromatic ring-hydroxylating dioxygenase subunit alpha n=1 Tax=Paraburkholderia sp. BL10I2N1 TaxID=1938796 RepID=UPI00105EC0FA|nr:aromatic ring-hydroxylating dioxygenase subunit alpha [Paraburkholderia sp. BL10I2N1]TDN57939.1 phenylpropionate dioxygenase-like ring-hydroxylating dioxygenase large terminal subunit [Paraburkholderia sp. BL10I2N1]